EEAVPDLQGARCRPARGQQGRNPRVLQDHPGEHQGDGRDDRGHVPAVRRPGGRQRGAGARIVRVALKDRGASTGGVMARQTFFLLPLLALTALAGPAHPDERPADKIPDYRPVSGWPKVPDDVTLGPVSAVATDSADRVYVFHRGKRPVL